MARPEILQPPGYCEYNAGACDQDFTALQVSGTLFLYASTPETIAATIEQTTESGSKIGVSTPWRSWKTIPVHGQIIFQEICKAIRFSKNVVADVTTLNFNLMFEIGFAIGLGLPVIPIRDTSYTRDDRDFEELGILQTLGYVDFTNSDGLVNALTKRLPADPLPAVPERIFVESPLYVLKDPLNIEGTVQLMSSIKKSRIKFRTYDPVEVPTLRLTEARRQVSGSIAVIAHLLHPDRRGSTPHNALCALISGMAMAQQKVVVMLQEGKVNQPIDYRDVVLPYTNPGQIPKLLERAIPMVVDRLQPAHTRAPKETPSNLLEELDLGDVAAENEILALEDYFYATGQFLQARQGHARLVIGRKGTGKTAMFYKIRDPLTDSQSRLVLDLKPEGHQFARLREFVLDRMTVGMQEHTMVAFWHYLLLAEMARKILLREWTYAQRDQRRMEKYQAIESAYGTHEPDFDADFSQRLLREVDLITKRLENVALEDIGGKLTEYVFTGDATKLETALRDYLEEKEEVWLLIDNLDKGWPTHGSRTQDIQIVRALLEATRKLQQRFAEKEIPFRCLVFLRTDIHEHLMRDIPDKGKDTAITLDWDDPVMFEEVVRLRIEANTELEGSFAELWGQICDTHIEIQDTFNYIVERTLMRPRDLLLFIRRCVEVAVNRRHSRISVEDILQAERSYSQDMLYMLAYEIQDTQPDIADLVYTFHASAKELTPAALHELIRDAGIPDEKVETAIDLLLRFGFLGVFSADSREELYFHTVQSDIRRLLLPIKSGRGTYVIHAAFREALSIK